MIKIKNVLKNVLSIDKTKTNKATQLQFLRFIAFLFIFSWHIDIYHMKFMAGGDGAAWAVSFFFILSGFVTGYSSYNKNVKIGIKEIINELWKKIKKFYPLYFSMIVITIAFSKIPTYIALYKFSELWLSLIQLLKNILLIQSWFPSGYFSYCGVGWFLSTIMFLYIFNIPFKYTLNKITKIKFKYIIYFLIFAVSIISIVVYSYCVRNLNMEFYNYVLPISRIGEYIGGMTAGFVINLFLEKIKDTKFNKLIFTMLEIISILICYYFIYKYNSYIFWQSRIVRWLLPNFILIITFGFGKGYISQLFRIKFLVTLGNISFECFLLHQIIILIYLNMSKTPAITTSGNLFSVCISLLITVSIAYFIYDRNLDKKILKEKK